MLSDLIGADALVLLLFFFVISVGSFVVWLWALIDSISRPDWAYERARSNKMLWIILNIFLAPITSLIYLFAIRPQVRAAEAGAYSQPGQVAAASVGVAAPLPRFCGRCGSPVPSGAAFCGRCGQALASPTP